MKTKDNKYFIGALMAILVTLVVVWLVTWWASADLGAPISPRLDEEYRVLAMVDLLETPNKVLIVAKEGVGPAMFYELDLRRVRLEGFNSLGRWLSDEVALPGGLTFIVTDPRSNDGKLVATFQIK